MIFKHNHADSRGIGCILKLKNETFDIPKSCAFHSVMVELKKKTPLVSLVTEPGGGGAPGPGPR